ncbi:MAG: aldehyde dehydrogenase [Lachnospiraceae bacterium]|nr:aldehyde dehydrogenase [Lachnospiraceae bacterium]
MKSIVDKQRKFFDSGATLPVSYRVNALKKLKTVILEHNEDILKALKEDLGKSNFEAYMCEVGMVLSELTYMIKHIKRFAKEKRVATPLAQFASRSFIKPSPYGNVLIMSPWNYPFMLAIDPLIDAIAAGNTAVVKPSAYSPATSSIIKTIIAKAFAPEYVTVVTGGREENQALLDQEFDYIFFTGSYAVGKEVMYHASKRLTPITLELGGKSPCIVDSSAKIKLAAKRIVFGKFLNCGQTCVAPDYILCDEKIANDLISELKVETVKQYGSNPLKNADYGKIINSKHFLRLLSLIDSEKVVQGGQSNEKQLRIAPTIMTNVSYDDAIMQEEIFGPIMPIITYKDIDEALAYINSQPKPLALYLFSENKKMQDKVLSKCSFGGGCINDTIIHLATSNMGFGGVGQSGMGSYHGREGFNTFSHRKSIVDKKTWLDLPMRYQPYKSFSDKLIHFFLK